MPGRSEAGRDSRLIWAIVAAPWLVLAVFLFLPGLRARLLGGAAAAERLPDAPLAAPVPGLSVATPEPSPVSPASVTPTPTPPPPTPQAAAGGLAASTRPTPLALGTSPELDRLLDGAYRSRLPPGIGPLRARIDSGRFAVTAELDLDRMGEQLKRELPAALAPLAKGQVDVELMGRLLSAKGGVAQLELEGLRVGPVPVPASLFGLFLRGELEARGIEGSDPLRRRVWLPAGFDSGAIEGDQLELWPAGGR